MALYVGHNTISLTLVFDESVMECVFLIPKSKSMAVCAINRRVVSKKTIMAVFESRVFIAEGQDGKFRCCVRAELVYICCGWWI